MNRRFLFGLGSFLIVIVIVGFTEPLLFQKTIKAFLPWLERQSGISPGIQLGQRKPILIPGIREPDEMQVEPFPITNVELTAPERELAEATSNFSKVNLVELLPALDRILGKYPDFADGYVFRFFAFCERNDRHRALSDLDNALKFISSSRNPAGKSISSLLSMRAKMEYANGDYVTAINDLESAIRADFRNAVQFTNSGAVKPEKTASLCTWTEPDMDALVQRFPTDYRTYLLRGLYYTFFTTFDDGDTLRNRALDEFRQAADRNANSALPHYFAAQAVSKGALFKQLSMSDDQRTAIYRARMDELNKALVLDPRLLPALSARAETYFRLKQFRAAIADYDSILTLDPNDAGAYNDRGLAKMEFGQTYDAISDFTKAIEKKPRELMKTNSYENRADAYMKTRQWDLAISDLTKAISLQMGGVVLLMNIDQFRTIYPEYKSASNDDVTRKLHETFHPNLKYEDFAKRFVTQDAIHSGSIPELYLKRVDAYLKKGNWHQANIDFQRVINGFPDYVDAVDRWREIGKTVGTENYIDMKTFDDSRKELIRLWIKTTENIPEWARRDGEPYALQQFELNCAVNQIRTVSSAKYDGSGKLAGGGNGSEWASTVPETLGETLYNAACRNN